ncbi:hypothetical protein [Salsuginibacillus kocurii]|uniref:hypothetical protein n=1 Tax=Salsuginibacillus kocurii TaxID=427078 RepID=UPI00036AC769|nr:hypothetical protein [Salsuginibacillus kocurii]
MDRTRLLLKFSAVFAVIGVIMGSHMAGAGSPSLSPIHAHILVVGWLSLFAFAVFYKVFSIPKSSKLANSQAWTGALGSIGLTLGMYLHYFQPGGIPDVVYLIFYIVGGSVLALSFFLFAIIVFHPQLNISEE